MTASGVSSSIRSIGVDGSDRQSAAWRPFPGASGQADTQGSTSHPKVPSVVKRWGCSAGEHCFCHLPTVYDNLSEREALLMGVVEVSVVAQRRVSKPDSGAIDTLAGARP
jgi:hypothetical protein